MKTLNDLILQVEIARNNRRTATRMLELLSAISNRAAYWCNKEYLLREYKEVCSQDADALYKLSQELQESGILVHGDDTSVGVVRGMLITMADVRTKAAMNSFTSEITNYITAAWSKIKLAQLRAWSEVKEVQNAIENYKEVEVKTVQVKTKDTTLTKVALTKQQKKRIVCLEVARIVNLMNIHYICERLDIRTMQSLPRVLNTIKTYNGSNTELRYTSNMLNKIYNGYKLEQELQGKLW